MRLPFALLCATMRFAMYTAQELISDLERRAQAKGVPIRRLVKKAGINSSTWTRWKSGQTTPTFGTWERLSRTADEMLGPEPVEAAE